MRRSPYGIQLHHKALTLLRADVPNHRVAKECGVPAGTIAYWKHEDRKKRGDPLPGKGVSRAFCPICGNGELSERAYSYLLGLYLGDGHVMPQKNGTVKLTIACCDGWPDLIRQAEKAMAVVLPIASVSRRQRQGCTDVQSHSKHWLCLFPQHGPGKKHNRPIVLSPWQQRIVEGHTRDFLRGLIHSDGCRFTNRIVHRRPSGERVYEYAGYAFSNKSVDILNLCGWALDRLGVAWRYSRKDLIAVTRRASVEQLDDFIGPKS